MTGSVGRVGAADNAMMESTIGLYKTELVHTRTWASVAELEAATDAWVAWFNIRGCVPPWGLGAPRSSRKGMLSSTARYCGLREERVSTNAYSGVFGRLFRLFPAGESD